MFKFKYVNYKLEYVELNKFKLLKKKSNKYLFYFYPSIQNNYNVIYIIIADV